MPGSARVVAAARLGSSPQGLQGGAAAAVCGLTLELALERWWLSGATPTTPAMAVG